MCVLNLEIDSCKLQSCVFQYPLSSLLLTSQCPGRPEILNVNCASSLLMIFFVIDLVEKSRTPAKDDFLCEFIRRLVLETLSIANAERGMPVLVGDLGELQINQSGNVMGLQSMLETFHRSTMLSWMGQWNSMLAANLVSTDWATEGLPLMDVVFLITVVKVRRRQNKSPWQARSMEARNKLVNAFAKVLENTLMKSMVDYMQHHDVYNSDVPSRQLRPNTTFKSVHGCVSMNDIDMFQVSLHICLWLSSGF